MKVAVASLKSVSPYSQSKFIVTAREASESHDDHERRCWRERIHRDAHGRCYIPPMAFKKAIDSAAGYESIKIHGKGNATYSKRIVSGTIVMDPLDLALDVDQVPGEWLHLDANGKKGKQSSARVLRCMPRFDFWQGDVRIHILDEIVLNTRPGSEVSVLEHVLRTAGSLIGIGRFRPENGGFYGRFVVSGFSVVEPD